MNDIRTAAIPTTGPNTMAEAGNQTHTKRETSHKPLKGNERFDLFESEHGKPYTVKYFDLNDYWGYKQDPNLDIDGVLGKVESVEKYVMEVINEKGLHPTTKSFDFLMDEVLSKIGDIPTEEGKYKLDRISTFIKNYEKASKTRNRLKKLEEEINNVIY